MIFGTSTLECFILGETQSYEKLRLNLLQTFKHYKSRGIFLLKQWLDYLYGHIQISAWFILLSLHANPNPEIMTM